ncbi:MAG: glycosyltransferase family 4 protein [Thermoplasmatales archaeon]|nr:glycosyltransferase family 4 protein [Thermoplasmatales archaeon]
MNGDDAGWQKIRAALPIDGVTLLRRPDDGKKTSLVRYGDELESTLEGLGLTATPVSLRMDATKGLSRFVADGMIKPFVELVLRRKGRNRVVHAADEMAGFAFPWSESIRVVTVHHVITPGERGPLYYSIWKLLSTLAIRHADSIITVSDETAADVLAAFKVDPDKITVIPHRTGAAFRPTGAKKTRRVCCVGELVPRKNISDSILAFNEFLSLGGVSDYTMVICGEGSEKTALSNLVKDLGISDKVSFVSGLDDDEMVQLLETSMAFLVTSLHEGFGMTILEAQSCGTPTLHLSTSRLPAVAFGASIPCGSVADMAEKLHELVTDENLYAEQVRKSLAYAEGFREGFGEKLLSAYLLGSRTRAGNGGSQDGS